MKNQIRHFKEVQTGYQDLASAEFGPLSILDPDIGFGRI